MCKHIVIILGVSLVYDMIATASRLVGVVPANPCRCCLRSTHHIRQNNSHALRTFGLSMHWLMSHHRISVRPFRDNT